MFLEDGTNVDNWTMNEITEVVTEYIQYANSLADPNGNPEYEQQPFVRQESCIEEDDDRDWVDIPAEEKKRNEEWNLPTVKTRNRAPTNKLTSTAINNRKVTLKVTDSQIKRGGFFSSDYVIYQVQTEPLSWKVARKDLDFYTIRKILKLQFPHILVPPLPIKTYKMT